MLYNGFLPKAALALALISSAQAAPTMYGTFPDTSPALSTNVYQQFEEPGTILRLQQQ